MTMARAGAVLFAAGGSLALLSLAVPHWRIAHPVQSALMAVPALPTAALLWLFAEHIPEWAIHALLVLAAVQLSLGVYFLGAGAAGATAGGYYTWISIFAFYFLRRRVALAHLAFMGAAYAAALLAVHARGGPAQWIVTMGTAAVGGLVVGSLADRLRQQAGTDVLTGLANRRSWEQTLDRELARAWRLHLPVAVVVIDLDDFKALNDRYGHGAGDKVLADLGDTIRGVLRSNDTGIRLGGEEVLLLLADAREVGAREVLARLSSQWSKVQPGVTFSAGICVVGDVSPGEAVAAADAALYRAKSDGRNCWRFAEPAGEGRSTAETWLQLAEESSVSR